MAIVKEIPGYKVDGRVSIAMDALDDPERRAVGDIITDRSRFLASTSDGSRVRRLSKDRPFYALKVPSGLRIIYSQAGDEIVVMDLMRQATLDRYGRRPTRAKSGRGPKGHATPRQKKAK